jgi:hypothetical protein
VAGVDFGIISVQKPAMVRQYRTLQLENGLGFSQSLHHHILLTVAARATATSAVIFVIVDNFSSLTALMREFSWFYDIFMPPYTFSIDNFFSCRLFRALVSAATKSHASAMAQTR